MEESCQARLDGTTEYLWEDPPTETGYQWDAAVAYCASLSLAGLGSGEWHLPTIDMPDCLALPLPTTQSPRRQAPADPSCDAPMGWQGGHVGGFAGPYSWR